MKSQNILLSLGLLLPLNPAFSQQRHETIQEVNGSDIQVRISEFNPGRNTEWDDILEFSLRYELVGVDSVRRTLSKKSIGSSPTYEVLEAQLTQNPVSFMIDGEALGRRMDRSGQIQGEALSLVWVDENFFSDTDQAFAVYDLNLIPWTKPISAQIADTPRPGRRAEATLGVLKISLQKMGDAAAARFVPERSIRRLAEDRWAGAENDYEPFSIKMMALRTALDSVTIPFTTTVPESESKMVSKLENLFKRIEAGSEHQVKAESYRTAQRYLAAGLPLLAIAKFFGWIEPGDAPSGQEGLLEITKMLGKAEYHEFMANRNFKRVAEDAIELKEAIEKSAQPDLRAQVSSMSNRVWDSLRARIGRAEDGEEANAPSTEPTEGLESKDPE